MNNVQRFLDAFAKIERSLKQITGMTRYTGFFQLLNQASKKNALVRKAQLELQEYAELRNALVHQRSGEGSVLAIPVEEVVEDIERLANQLTDPERVGTHFQKPVKICYPDTDIHVAFEIMEKMETSKVPVYYQGGFHSLLTMEMIARWMMNQCKHQKPLTGRVSDCLVYKSRQERVRFLSKEATVSDAQELFEDALHKGISLSAILITETGQTHQKPVGIITVSDLPMLYSIQQ